VPKSFSMRLARMSCELPNHDAQVGSEVTSDAMTRIPTCAETPQRAHAERV